MTIGSLINDVESLLGLSTGYLGQLQPASWRGVPFAVRASRGQFGRRNATHDYPYRDDPWIEDMGRGRRAIRLTGFLIGDDVIAQSKRMITASETNGDGELVHPIFGRVQMSLLDFAISHDVEGRCAQLDFQFTASAKRIYPTSTTSTSAETGLAAADADGAASTSYLSRIASALKSGEAAVRGAIATVTQYGGLVFRLVTDATSLVKTVQALPGEFGRFFAGASSTLFGANSVIGALSSNATVAQLISTGAQSRANVSTAMTTAQSGAGALSVSTAATFAAQSQAVFASLTAAIADPADQVRMFTNLQAFVPTFSPGTSNLAVAQSVTADLWRRAALTALARASAAYQPSSYDDAATLRVNLIALLDSEIGIAGDQGEDDVFNAFRALKSAVALDLTTRGATLAPIVTISFPAALPAPVVAMKLYQDASRSDELVGEAKPRHPAFMPLEMRVLAS